MTDQGTIRLYMICTDLRWDASSNDKHICMLLVNRVSVFRLWLRFVGIGDYPKGKHEHQIHVPKFIEYSSTHPTLCFIFEDETGACSVVRGGAEITYQNTTAARNSIFGEPGVSETAPMLIEVTHGN